MGYPVYVVNATTPEHVAMGVNFAAANNIRLIVKATGHDYLGRSASPNSLSIWTHNMRGINFHGTFQPQGCHYSIPTTAVTAAAGHNLLDLYAATDSYNSTIVGGLEATVGIGGYLTGGGHSPLSSAYGIAADNILELSVITPSGSMLTVNECQNTDLFYAFRGGGGGTFGVMTNVTLKTYPTPPVSLLSLQLTMSSATDDIWDMIAYILTQYPYLSNKTITAYPEIAATTSGNTTTLYFTADFRSISPQVVPYLLAAMQPIISHIQSTWPAASLNYTTSSYPTFYSHFLATAYSAPPGYNFRLGSRLLDAPTLTGNLTALTSTVKSFCSQFGCGPLLLGGKGIWDAVPRGGSDAVNPAWRKTVVHFVTGALWAENNATAKASAVTAMEQRVTYLRDLLPNSGAYLNEANQDEPDFQQAFWGTNYPKLAAIKKAYDPTDVFWCHPCVGNEGWKEVGDMLCRV